MGKIITSFDIGIRNLAYCTMEYRTGNISGNQFFIHDWNVLDLLKNDQSDAKNKKCQVRYKSGSKKGETCDKPAHYYHKDGNNTTNICKMHAKMYDITQISRLYTVANTNLYELARLAVTQLNKVDFSKSEEIIFESQPSKNPKMKNFSMILFNYFIIRYIAEKPENEQNLKDVKFVSSRNKLTVYDGPYIECHLKGQHARNKFYGKVYCRHLIRYNLERLHFLDTFKKTDDLCDSFLQGAWYLMNGYKMKSIGMLDDSDEPDEPDDSNILGEHKSKECQDEPVNVSTGGSNLSNNGKIMIKLKKTLTGKELLQQIKSNPLTSKIKSDYNLNKYKQLKRGCKPRVNCDKYTLSNIKYVIDHNQYDAKNTHLVSSMRYYFGDATDTILSKK
jgi:hypothetical protein